MLAQKYDTTVTEIANENAIKNPDCIFVGQKLNIGTAQAQPASSYVSNPIPTPALAQQDNYSMIQCGGLNDIRARRYGVTTYTVKKGDTLSAIKNAHNIDTIRQLCAANNIPFDIDPKTGFTIVKRQITPGQKLLIPQMPREEKKDDIIPIARQIARMHGVREDLVLAVIEKESEFNPRACSGCGAMGLMQLMPEVAKSYGLTNPYDIVGNIDGGVRHLKWLLEKYKGNIDLVIMAYNAGPGNVDRRGANLSNYAKETQAYLPKVKELMKKYESSQPRQTGFSQTA
jgi:hypothetical protein